MCRILLFASMRVALSLSAVVVVVMEED